MKEKKARRDETNSRTEARRGPLGAGAGVLHCQSCPEESLGSARVEPLAELEVAAPPSAKPPHSQYPDFGTVVLTLVPSLATKTHEDHFFHGLWKTFFVLGAGRVNLMQALLLWMSAL